MTASDFVENRRPLLWAFGPIPPPVTGMTLLTERVLLSLQRAGPVKFCNWSHGSQTATPRARAKRVLRTLQCLYKLIQNGRVRDGRLYLVANSRAGLLLTSCIVSVARHLNHRIYLHHHTYGYIDRYNRWMAWINRGMGSTGVHVVHCHQMVDDFRRQYPTTSKFETIFPSVVSIDIRPPRPSASTPFRLGMLSNLTVAKGVDLAIETFRTLRESDSDVRLKLAGPIRDRAAESSIERAVKQYSGKVQYVGPVYGEAKADFLGSIDALLFPTRYNDESWGIVINEALAAAAPVITFDRGCTRTVVGESAGLLVARDGDYVSAAVKQIERWIGDSDEYRAASRAAVEQAEYLHRQGQIQLDQFTERVFGPLDG